MTVSLLSLGSANLADLRLLLFSTVLLGFVCSAFLYGLSRLIRVFDSKRHSVPLSRLEGYGFVASPDHYWSLGTLLGTVGIVALSLQGQVPLAVSVVGGNVLILSGLGLVALGLREFFGRPRRRGFVLGFSLATFAAILVLTYLVPSVRYRAILFSLVSSLIMLDSGLTLLGARRRNASRVSLLTPSVFLFMCIFLAFRALYFVYSPVSSIFSPGLMTSLTFITFNFGFVSWTLALVVLRSGRLLADIQQGEELYRGIFEHASTGIFQSTVDGHFIRINESFARLYGYDSVAQLYSAKGTSTAWVYANPGVRGALLEILKSQGHFEDQEVASTDRAGSPIWVSVNASLINLGSDFPVITGTVVNVTNRHLEGEALAKSRDEKALLLQELQHRVKNGMGIIASLVGLEAARSPSEATRSTLDSLETKVSALASLYDLLYRTPEAKGIVLDEYLAMIAEGFQSSHGLEERGICLEWSLPPLEVDLKTAEALGLVAVELLTDCLKHAFPNGRRGKVDLSLRQDGGEAILVVEDDGVGLPPGFSAGLSKGLGMTIVETLASQLRGQFSASTGPQGGCRFVLRFPLKCQA